MFLCDLLNTFSPDEVIYEAVKPDFVVKDGVDDVSIPEELMEDVDPRWKYFVVGYFMNDASHIGSIHLTLNRIWSSPAGEGVEN